MFEDLAERPQHVGSGCPISGVKDPSLPPLVFRQSSVLCIYSPSHFSTC